MRIALNPGQFRDRPLLEIPGIVADLGYRFIDISGRDDLVPFFDPPAADAATIRSFRIALDHAGVEPVAVYGLFRWTSPDDEERRIAVASLMRTIEIAAELRSPAVSTEFGASSADPEASQARFWRSLERILPALERHGVSLWVEPHPDDFIERGDVAVDLLTGIGSPQLGYLYCVPHTFHMGDDVAAMLRHAQPILKHLHVADTFKPRRYIVNPLDQRARVHQHLDIGQGEIDWDAFFSTLLEIGYAGALSACTAGWDDRAEASARAMLVAIEGYLAKHSRDKASHRGTTQEKES